MNLMNNFILMFALIASAVTKPMSVVVWHGMGDTGSGKGIVRLSEIIRTEIPGTYVLDLQLGPTSFADRMDTYFMPINTQIMAACKIVHSDPKLTDGFHLIGLSQGGLFVRGLVQRCPPNKLGAVVSIGGPQQGVYGLPSCSDASPSAFCDLASRVLAKGAYLPLIQAHFVQAQYWHDPLQESVYREKSSFLAEINQERTFNQTYKDNLLKASRVVLVRFMSDTTVIPGESEWFGFYKSGQIQEKVNLTDSTLYKKDLLGLKILNEQGRLHLLALPGDHLHFTDSWFRYVLIRKYLM